MPDKPPRPRAPSSPDRPSIEVDTTVGAAKGYAASQDHVRPELARKGTLPGGMSAIPVPPPLPRELARTERAPSTTAQTVRVTPATGTRIVRNESEPQSLPGPSSELVEARAKIAEYERRERVQVESKQPGPYQPPIRSQSPVPSSSPEAKTDRAIGGLVRTLFARFGWPLLATLGVGGAVLKPAADPAKADATLVNVEAMRADLALIREQLSGVIRREAARDAYLRCVDEGMVDLGQQLLPAVDRQGNAQPLRAFVDRCQRLRP